MTTEEIRGDLLHRMIRIYGFEHPLVVQFAVSCGCYTTPDLAPMWNNILETIVKCHEAHLYRNEDE